jgi:hypothetical protein
MLNNDNMLVKKAKQVLTQPLIFGDSTQIEALTIMRLYNDVVEMINKHPDICASVCKECEGTCEVEYYDSDRGKEYYDECDECMGTGKTDVPKVKELEDYCKFDLNQLYENLYQLTSGDERL